MPEPFALLRPVAATRPVLLQANVEHLDLAVQLHHEFGFDVVLTASSDRRRDPFATLENASRSFTERTGAFAQLDANRYAGPNRRIGATDLTQEWGERQARLGVPLIMTDAGYTDEDIAQVRAAIQKAKQLQSALDAPVLATIAVGAPMLRKHRNELVDIMGDSGLEIGLALGHAKDPLSSAAVVKTLIELVGLGTVHPRRIDLSGIGALAFGAPTVSIGSTATLRHVYPSKGNGGPTSPWWSTLVPRTMNWRTHDRVMDAVSTFADHVFWNCPCRYCYGRSIASAVRTATAAMTHNFATVAMIAEDVLTSPDPRATWVSKCSSAQSYAYEVMEQSGPGWEPQDFLGAWVNNRPTPVQA